MNSSQHTMARRHQISLPTLHSKQRGMATLLIVLLVGIGLVSISVGAMHAIRSTQERQVAAHSQVNAQSAAWAAAEAVRKYLLSLTADEVIALPINEDWTLAGYTGFTPTVRFTAITGPLPPYNSYRLSTQIKAIVSGAQASSVLELVYEISPAAASVTTQSKAAVNYFGDLTLTGGITIKKDAGDTTPYEVNVMGNVTIRNTTVTGVDIVRSTGSVKLDGTTSFLRAVYSNCDVYVSGGTSPQMIHSLRNVFLNNTNRQGYPVGESCDSVDMRANGSISLDGANAGCGHNNVFALAGKGGFSQCGDTNGGLSEVTTEVTSRFTAAAVSPTDTAIAGGVFANWGSKTSAIRSNNDIIIQGTAIMGQLHAERDIKFLGNGNTLAEFARYGRNLTPASPDGTYTQLFGLNNATAKDQKTDNYYFGLEPARPVSLQRETFDVRDYKDDANYAFRRDAAGDIRITVRNISLNGAAYTLEDGYLGKHDWVCPTKATANTAPTGCIFRVGRTINGDGVTSVIQYKNNKWDFDNNLDSTLAPGIMYFEGDLNIPSGTFTNTFLATGNITTSGAAFVYSPNYSGYSGVQPNVKYAIKNGVSKPPHGVCVNTIFTVPAPPVPTPTPIPTQFCKIDGSYDYSAVQKIGNYGLMAGTCAGQDPCNNANYRGGDIFTGASADVFGGIKAGNMFVSSGTTIVHGYVSALAQGIQTSNHVLGAETIVDLQQLPPGYDPTGGDNAPGTSTPGTDASIKILWSRYL